MKTLWALEPFHQDTAKNQMIYSLIKQFSPNDNQVDIGFIATRDIQSLNLAFDVPPHERYSLYPTKVIIKNLLKAKIPVHKQNIIVRDEDTLSTTTAVESLLKIAKKQKSELLAIFTQDKKDFLKFTLGSFAETAMEISPINLLIVSPNVKASNSIKTILYAANFKESGKQHINEMLELSVKLNSKIIIYHHSIGLALLKKDKKNKDLMKIKKELDQFSDWIQDQARLKKAKVKIILDGNFQSVSESILTVAKKEKSNLIAISSKKKGLKAIFLGSTTKQVVRQSELPVLVLKD